MRQRITLKKKNDPRKFVVPFLIRGIDYPSALYDTGSLVSILPKVMAPSRFGDRAFRRFVHFCGLL